MHVILIPGKRNSKANAASFRARHILTIAFFGLLFLPALVGVVTFRMVSMTEHRQEDPTVTAYREELQQSRVALLEARDDASRHLNAMAQRLGSLQAQVLRLNALGSRLTRMASLDAREFDFDSAPAVGGPERNLGVNHSSDVTRNLDALTREIDRSQVRLMALESLLLDRRLDAKVTPSAWPVDGGWISSSFGTRMDPFTGHQSLHEGIDISARYGGSIYATGDGVVSWAGDKSGYGLAVEVTHEAGLLTLYAHASEILVKEGDLVKKGQVIARVGSTGRSSGPHLHFEVLRNGQPVNPSRYLQQGITRTASR